MKHILVDYRNITQKRFLKSMKELFETTDPNNTINLLKKMISIQGYVHKLHLQIDTYRHSWIFKPSVETMTSTDNYQILTTVAERISNHYLVQELFWPLEVQIYIFCPMRMTDTILPGSPPWSNIKGCAKHFLLSLHLLASQPTWQSTFSLFSLLYWPAVGQTTNMTEYVLSLCFLTY